MQEGDTVSNVWCCHVPGAFSCAVDQDIGGVAVDCSWGDESTCTEGGHSVVASSATLVTGSNGKDEGININDY
jgi:hypothetical protein